MQKYEKMCLMLFLKYKCYFFCSTNEIFLVCSTNFLVYSTNFLVCRKKNFERAVQTFAESLPPFGVSFFAS